MMTINNAIRFLAWAAVVATVLCVAGVSADSTTTVDSAVKITVINTVDRSATIIMDTFLSGDTRKYNLTDGSEVWVYVYDICKGLMRITNDQLTTPIIIPFEIEAFQLSLLSQSAPFDITVRCTLIGKVHIHTQSDDNICVYRPLPDWAFFDTGLSALNVVGFASLIFVGVFIATGLLSAYLASSIRNTQQKAI